MAEFIRLDPAPTACMMYGTGACCHDRHLQANTVIKTALAHEVLCEVVNDKPEPGGITQDKKEVNCKACLEIIHS